MTYCIASHTGGGAPVLQHPDVRGGRHHRAAAEPRELLDYAQQLTTDEHAGFCVRGDNTQALYDAFQLWQWFYPYDNPVTGNYFDQDWTFLLAEEPVRERVRRRGIASS